MGCFSYTGPLTTSSAGWWSTIWTFSAALGSALGSTIDPIGFVSRNADGEWVESRWQKAHRPLRGRVGTGPPVGGNPPVGGHHQQIAQWVTALLTAGDDHPRLGLEVALEYLAVGPGQGTPEVRCRDLVNAIERLAVGLRREHDMPRRAKLGTTFRTVRKEGVPILTDDEIKALDRFRNRLAHEGDLLDDRAHNLQEAQQLLLAEGWLTTCCYRVLAAAIGVDVPLADLAVVGHPRRRPSEGGWAMTPFVPQQPT